MSRFAPWWNPENGQDSDVVRHAPDEHNYHYADGRQLERIGGGIGTPVLVPKARGDGRSMAFDPTVASVVHVDPDAPDGGTVVDLANLGKREINQALRSSRFPHEVYYQLGAAPADAGPAQRPPPRRRQDPLLASGYVVPAADAQGRQVWEPPAGDFGNYQMAYPVKEATVLPAAPPLPPASNGAAPPAAAGPAPVPMPPPQAPYPPAYPPPAYPGYYPPPAPAVDPNLQNMLAQVLGGMQGINQRLGQVEQRFQQGAAAHPAPAGVATLPVGRPGQRSDYEPTPIGQAPRRRRPQAQPDDDEDAGSTFAEDAEEIGARKGPRRPRRRPDGGEEPQRLTDVAAAEADPRAGVIVGFESLRLSFVMGPLPVKPKKRVFFDFGQLGKQSATYHDVVDSKECVALVYDTRYEEGTQFMPPDLNEQTITVSVPATKKEFQVSSMGLCFQLGVFDVIVLVKRADDSEEPGDEDA